jgi:hypothetical protein
MEILMCGNCFTLPRARFESRDEVSRTPNSPRVWPVFRRRRAIRRPPHRPGTVCFALWDRAQARSFRVECARHWLCATPLERQWDRVDEAITASRGTRA